MEEYNKSIKQLTIDMAKLSKKNIVVISLCFIVFILLPLIILLFISYRNYNYQGSNYDFQQIKLPTVTYKDSTEFIPNPPALLSEGSVKLDSNSKVSLLRDGYILESNNLSYIELAECANHPIYLADNDISLLMRGFESNIKLKIKDNVLKGKIREFKSRLMKEIEEKEKKSLIYPNDFESNLKKNKDWLKNISDQNSLNIEGMGEKQKENFKYLVSEAKLQHEFEVITTLLKYIGDEELSECNKPSLKEYKIGEVDKQFISESFAKFSTIMNFDSEAFTEELMEIGDYELGNKDESFLLNYSCFVKGEYNSVIIDIEGNLYNQIVDKQYIPQEIDNNNFSEKYDYEPIAQYTGTVRIPIFMYHQITQVPPNATGYAIGLYVTPEIFEQQMAYLVSKNYKSITPKELYDQLATGKNPTQKTVMITFDDASYGQYLNAYPILKKYGLIGVFYIPTFKSSISKAQLKEMADNGMIIDSHTRTHPNLQKEDDIVKLTEEIGYSRADLASFTGKQSFSIAYPGCVADKEALSVVASSGYLIGVSCGRGIDHSFNNRLVLSRVHVFNDMKSFKKLLSGIN